MWAGVKNQWGPFVTIERNRDREKSWDIKARNQDLLERLNSRLLRWDNKFLNLATWFTINIIIIIITSWQIVFVYNKSVTSIYTKNSKISHK